MSVPVSQFIPPPPYPLVTISLLSTSVTISTTSCLSIHRLMGIWAVSTFWLLWIMLQWTFVYKNLFEHLLSILLGIHLGVKLLGQVVTLLLFEEPPYCFPQRQPSCILVGLCDWQLSLYNGKWVEGIFVTSGQEYFPPVSAYSVDSKVAQEEGTIRWRNLGTSMKAAWPGTPTHHGINKK